MKNVISELYYGNIDPQARGFKNGSFLKKQMAVLSESEELDSFIVGFRLGARLIFDTFVNDDTPYDNLLKEQSE